LFADLLLLNSAPPFALCSCTNCRCQLVFFICNFAINGCNIQGDLAELVALATKELKKQNIEPPSGQAKIKRIGSSFKLEWTGSNIDVVVEVIIVKPWQMQWHKL
jgi:hypothetical protein